MLLRWIFFLTFFGLLQWYSFQVIKTIGLSKPLIVVYITLVGLILFDSGNVNADNTPKAIAAPIVVFLKVFILIRFYV